MSAAAVAEYESLLAGLSQLRIINCNALSALVWLVYDIFLTLDLEIEYIWTKSSSEPAGHFLNVYTCVLDITGSSIFVFSMQFISVPTYPLTCSGWLWFEGMSTQLQILLVTTIFVLRVNALYQSRLVLWFLILSTITQVAVVTAGTVLTLWKVSIITPPPGLPFTGCLSDVTSHVSLMSWVTCLAVATVFFTMTLFKFGQTATVGHMFSLSRLVSRGRAYPLMTAFIRDGSVFFGMIAAALLLNTITTFTSVNGVGDPWIKAAYSIAGSRLILNLRSSSRAARQRLDMQSFSNISFKLPQHESVALDRIQRGAFLFDSRELASGGTTTEVHITTTVEVYEELCE